MGWRGFLCVCRLYRDDVMLHTYIFIHTHTHSQHHYSAETYYNAAISAESRSDFDYPCFEFNVGTWKPRRPGRCHVQGHLLLASIDLMSVHAVQRSVASRFIDLQQKYIVIVESASWDRTKSRVYHVKTVYTVCPDSATGTEKNTRSQLFIVFTLFYSKYTPSKSIQRWKRLNNFSKQSLYSVFGIAFKTLVDALWMSWMMS